MYYDGIDTRYQHYDDPIEPDHIHFSLLNEEDIIDDLRMYDDVRDPNLLNIHKASNRVDKDSESDEFPEELRYKNQLDRLEKEVEAEKISEKNLKKKVRFTLPKEQKTVTKIKEKVASTETSQDESSQDISHGNSSTGQESGADASEHHDEGKHHGGKHHGGKQHGGKHVARKVVVRVKKNEHKGKGSSKNSSSSDEADGKGRKRRAKGDSKRSSKRRKTDKRESGLFHEGLSQFFTKAIQRKYSLLAKRLRGKAGRSISGFVNPDGRNFNERKIREVLEKGSEELPIYCMLIGELLRSVLLGPQSREIIRKTRSELRRKIPSGPSTVPQPGEVQVRDKATPKSN